MAKSNHHNPPPKRKIRKVLINPDIFDDSQAGRGNLADSQRIRTKLRGVYDLRTFRRRDNAHFFRPRIRQGNRRLSLTLSIVKNLSIAVLMLFAVYWVYLIVNIHFNSNKFFNVEGDLPAALADELDPRALKYEGAARVNILIAGKGDDQHIAPDLIDTIIVASIDPFNKETALFSIPRDLYINYDAKYTKINSVYALAKEKAYRETARQNMKPEQRRDYAESQAMKQFQAEIERYFDINVDYYVLVNFKSFIALVDFIGGIEMDIEKDLYDHRSDLNLQAGRQTLDGQQALSLVRSRSIFSRGDFDRSKNQREILRALTASLDKKISLGDAINPLNTSQYNKLIEDDILPNVVHNFSRQTVDKLYELSKDIDSEDIKSYDFVTDPKLLRPKSILGASYVVPVAGNTDYRDVQAFVRQILPDGLIVQEDASITLINASGSENFGAGKKEILEQYNYKVVDYIAEADFDIDRTAVITTNSASQYTSHYLSLRFGSPAIPVSDFKAGDLSDYDTDIIVILR